MKNTLLRALVALCLLAGLSACSPLTLENYEKLKVGMSYEEVKGILGKPDQCSELLVVRQCTWGNDKTGISANFMAEKLVTHSATNLR
jgi:hypothetical protein